MARDLWPLNIETFPECQNFGNYYFRRHDESSQQTQQMWNIFACFYFQMEAISSVFEDDMLVNLEVFFWPYFSRNGKFHIL